MTMTDREQFEAWAREWGLPLMRGFYADRYEAISTNYAWDAWQAARRAEPEGWKLVPVEPTEAEVEAGCRALWASEDHKMMAAAGFKVDFESQPKSILLPLRRKVRAVRQAVLAAAAKAEGSS